MADVGVDFGRDRGARNVGVFLGRDTRCAESGCFPGRVARKTGVPRTKVLICIGLLLYKLGLSANLLEVLSTCMNVY